MGEIRRGQPQGSVACLVVSVWLSVFADDYRLEAAGSDIVFALSSVVWLFVLCGIPIKWTKAIRGTTYPWIGLEVVLEGMRSASLPTAATGSSHGCRG